jgi:putative membrane protein
MSNTGVATDSTHLALDRTWLAHERTLMAWVRTATSMISFGFTIYKFFQFEVGRGAPATRGIVTPRDFALIMVSIGLVALLMATISHRREIRGLADHLDGRRSRAEVVAALVSVFGFLVLFSAIFHG